jgi:Fur family transcriptional regulator, ferric uptake regulator
MSSEFESQVHYPLRKVALVAMEKQVTTDVVNEKERGFQKFIQTRGLKSTKQRSTIVSVFFNMMGHISVEELLREVKAVNPKIGYATVYRTLHLLVESGLVEERRFGDGLARYEGHSQVEHHDHMICQDCGKIFEFFNPELEALQEKLAVEHNFVIHRHRLELYGQCMDTESCRTRQTERKGQV